MRLLDAEASVGCVTRVSALRWMLCVLAVAGALCGIGPDPFADAGSELGAAVSAGRHAVTAAVAVSDGAVSGHHAPHHEGDEVLCDPAQDAVMARSCTSHAGSTDLVASPAWPTPAGASCSRAAVGRGRESAGLGLAVAAAALLRI